MLHIVPSTRRRGRPSAARLSGDYALRLGSRERDEKARRVRLADWVSRACRLGSVTAVTGTAPIYPVGRRQGRDMGDVP